MKKKANLFAAISHIHEAMHQLKMIGALDPSYPRDGDEKVLDVALHSLRRRMALLIYANG